MSHPLVVACTVAVVAVLATGCGGEAVPEASQGDAAEPEGVDPRVSQIQALGYAQVAEPLADGERSGVLRHDVERAGTGLNLFTSGNGLVQLMDMEGRVYHGWRLPDSVRAGNAIMLPDGDLFATGRREEAPLEDNAFVVRIGWDGVVRWRTMLTSHHDVDRMLDGNLATLTTGMLMDPDFHEEHPVRDQLVAILSPAGKVLKEVSILEVLKGCEEIEFLKRNPRLKLGKTQVDNLHVNTIEFGRHEHLFDRHPLYGPRAALISARHQDLIVAFDIDTLEVLWHWGQGEISGPHDATRLENGNVLIFDNGLATGQSRVVEVNPMTNEIVRSDDGGEGVRIFTATQGAGQRLSNGNTLMTQSSKGSVLEFSPEGELVWEFLNHVLSEDDEPYAIVRMRRYEGMSFEELEEHVRRGTVPRVD